MKDIFLIVMLLLPNLLAGQKNTFYNLEAIDLTTDTIGDSNVKGLFEFNNQLYFRKDNELFHSAGTTASSEGTGVFIFNRNLIIKEDQLLAFQSGNSFLFTDGTEALEQRYDFFDPDRQVTTSALVKFGDDYYVLALGTNRFEVTDYLRLMRIDLDEAVPEVVFELEYDRLESIRPNLAINDATLYFTVPEEDEATGTLYSSDGTTEGTQTHPGDVKFNNLNKQQLLSLPNGRMVLFNAQLNVEDISAGLYLFPGTGQPGEVLEDEPFNSGIQFSRELLSYYLIAPSFGPAYRFNKTDGTVDRVLGPDLLGEVEIIDILSTPTSDRLLLWVESRENGQQEVILVNEEVNDYQSIFIPRSSDDLIMDLELNWPELAIGVGLLSVINESFELTSRIELFDLEQETQQTVLLGDDRFVGLNNLHFYGDGLFFVFETESFGREIHYFQTGVERSIRGTAYEDVNANGVRDPGESGISSYPIMLSGHPRLPLYTNAEGTFETCLAANDQFVIDTAQGTCWELTTMPEQYQVSPSTTAISGLDFGFQWQENTDLEVLLQAGHLRCGEEIPFWLTFQNNGCTTRDSVELSIALDDRVRFSTSEQPPHEVTDDRIVWRAPVLEGGTTLEILFTLDLVTSDNDSLPLEMLVAGGSTTTQDTFNYVQELNCNGTDNMLSVSPARPDPTNANFIRVDEKLHYSFRYQNTTGEPLNIAGLTDNLGTHINVETIRIKSINQPYEAFFYGNGIRDSFMLLEFYDEAILVDSSINKHLSYLVGTFEAQLFPATPPGTIVTNNIEFYANGSVDTTTNTTKNTVVAHLDEDNDGYNFWEDCVDTLAAINPAAFDEFGNGIDENCDGVDGTVATRNAALPPVSIRPNPTRDKVTVDWLENRSLRVEVFNVTGRLVQRTRLNTGGEIDLRSEPPGIYFVRLSDDRGRNRTLRIAKH